MYVNDQLDVLLASYGQIFVKRACWICDLLVYMLLQYYLTNIVAWTIKKNMELNVVKFEVLNYSLNKSLLLRKLRVPLIQSPWFYYHWVQWDCWKPKSSTLKQLFLVTTHSQMLVSAKKTQTSHDTSYYHNSLGVKATRIWNLLPEVVNKRTSLDFLKLVLENSWKASPTHLQQEDTPLLIAIAGYRTRGDPIRSLLGGALRHFTCTLFGNQ